MRCVLLFCRILPIRGRMINCIRPRRAAIDADITTRDGRRAINDVPCSRIRIQQRKAGSIQPAMTMVDG